MFNGSQACIKSGIRTYKAQLHYSTYKYLFSLFRLDENLGLEKGSPLLFAPATGNFAGNETIPEDGWGDMDRVLTGELNCVLEFVSDRITAVGSALVGEEVSQLLLFVLADNGQGELDELGPSLNRSAVGRGNIVEILLMTHEGEMKGPELLGANTGNS